ncbi:MAG: hypothetical protein IJ551_02180 [Prevotella sp.]|nr:hypothetical protein [Prevotella sp.]MBQ8711623.1 hypothetical protein [Prevotella sp.]
MSDKQSSSLTPIIVGVIIALIGILTGFYVADNANEQLAALQQQGQQAADQLTDAPATSAKSTQSEEQPEMQELPPLDPITEVPDVLPEVDEPAADEQADVEEPTETPKTDGTAPADEPEKLEAPTKVEPVKDDMPADAPDEGDVDDFEEVSPEEMKNATP